jgi:hypothetical protein
VNAPEQAAHKPTAPENLDEEILARLERLEEILCAIHNLLLVRMP